MFTATYSLKGRTRTKTQTAFRSSPPLIHVQIGSADGGCSDFDETVIWMLEFG